eukprot:jgi/Psemu1/14616/gm1.14616_g
MIATRIATRTLLVRNTGFLARRSLSTQGQEAVGRLKDALEQYRAQNYQQELPSRFKKELVGQCNKTIASSNNNSSSIDRSVAVQGIEQLLQNIGIFGKQVTHDDVEIIVSELGEEHEESAADKILQKVL